MRAVYVSNVCEAFSCLPVPGRSALEQPMRLVRNILALRNYRQASGMIKGTVFCGADGPPPEAQALVGQVMRARMLEDEWLAEQADQSEGVA
jgi:hypothetical protein